MLKSLFLISIALYFIGLIFLIIYLKEKKYKFSLYSEYLFLSGLVFHLIHCFFCPLKNVNMGQALSFLSLSLLLVYFLLRLLRNVKVGQTIFFFFSFLFSILSFIIPKSQIEIKNFSYTFFVAHIIITILGLGGLVSAIIYSYIYYIQERKLKEKSPSLSDFSLEKSNLFSLKSLRDGYVLYTLGIFMGYFWSYKSKGVLTKFTLKETSALISWIIFGILYYIQKKYGWRGKKVLFLYFLGLISILLAIAGIRIF